MMGKHIIHSTPSNNLPLEENPAIATITITVIVESNEKFGIGLI
jgi:hypothetical protein